jgi:hypothetical protein
MTKISDGGGGSYVLWDNGSGTAALWRVAASGEITKQTFGPFIGWRARAVATGPAGRLSLLWTGRDQAAFLWSLSADGETHRTPLGPYAGWQARALAVGPDGAARVLWTAADGTAAVWQVPPEEAPTVWTLGPFDGWTATALAVGADNWARLLWNRKDGEACVWLLDESGEALRTGCGSQPGWNAVAVAAAAAAGESHMLWQGTGGRAAVAALGPDETIVIGGPDPGQALPRDPGLTVHGPFAGWAACAVAVPPAGGVQVLWAETASGNASLWRIAPTDGAVTRTALGPCTGWQAVGLAAEQEPAFPNPTPPELGAGGAILPTH